MAMVPVTWALYEARDVTPSEKVVLIVLADHAAPNGTGAFPSWARIAAASGVSRRTVARVLESLEARGLILRGDQEIAAERLHAAGKDVRYAPVVWDLVMDGSHSDRTHTGLPPVVDTNDSPDEPNAVHSAGGRGSAADAAAGHQGCQSGTSGQSDVGSAGEGCHMNTPRGATGGTHNQVQNQEQETNHHRTGATAATQKVAPPGDPVSEADSLARAVLSGLPSAVAQQMVFGVVAARCRRLVGGGWTAKRIGAVASRRSWAGAGPGAVIVWIDSLDCHSPGAPGGERSEERTARVVSDRVEDRRAREAQLHPTMMEVRRTALEEIRQILAAQRDAEDGTPNLPNAGRRLTSIGAEQKQYGPNGNDC